MSVKVQWLAGGFYRQFTGIVLAEEIKSTNDLLYGDHRFDDLRYHVADFLDVEDVVINELDLKVLAALDSAAAKSNNKIKLAIAVREPRLIDLVAHYKVESRADGWLVEIFDELEPAMQWARS